MRLVSLTGPGGVGKTRLAIAVARELVDDYVDGVAFVDLTPIHDPTLVPVQIARAFGVREERGRALLDDLRAFVAERTLLLVLDNCEQVLPGLTVAMQLLSASPGLKCLATSRERLHLRGERELSVEPLAVPMSTATDESAANRLSALADVPAIRLFVERAEEAKPGFGLSDANASAVTEICRRLEGVPLALELAAARVRHLPPQALLDRLQRRLPELSDGPRDLPDRQQTLHATVAWSHELLSPAQQAFFRHLAVFAGGFTLEAVEAVCSGRASGRGSREPDLLNSQFAFEGVASLMDKSLVRQAEPEGTLRHSMLETVREYALERLVESGDDPAIRQAYAAYFLGLAETADKHLEGAEEGFWKVRLEAEHDNMRAALAWLLDAGSPSDGLRLATALRRFWVERGYPSEGRSWLERALARVGDKPTLERAGALGAAGLMAILQGDLSAAADYANSRLAIGRRLDDQREVSAALRLAGMVAWRQGDLPAGVAHLDEALTIERGRDSPNYYDIAWLLRERATLAHVGGDMVSPVPLLEESIDLFRQIGSLSGRVGSLSTLAIVLQSTGEDERAEVIFEECIAIWRELGNKLALAQQLGNLANLPQVQADPPRAANLYRESLVGFAELGDRASIAEALDDIAGFAAAIERATEAAGLLGSSQALRAAIGLPRPPVFHHLTDQAIAAATRILASRVPSGVRSGSDSSIEGTIAETDVWLTEEQARELVVDS
jgi:predicted ATPase